MAKVHPENYGVHSQKAHYENQMEEEIVVDEYKMLTCFPGQTLKNSVSKPPEQSTEVKDKNEPIENLPLAKNQIFQFYF